MRVTGELQRQAWLEGRLPPIEQVRPGLWSVPVPIPRSPLRYTLTYVVETASGLLVLDPGWDVDGAWQALLGAVTTIGAAVSDVRGVVVTHVHPDHHGLSARLREASGAWVAMHPAEAATLPARVWATGDRGHQDEEWLRRCGLPADVVAELVLPPEAMKAFLAMAEPDRLLEDGDLVPDAGRPLRAVWTPGHTPGHLCFHDETDDLLLSGDHVLPRISPNIGLQPHTADPPLAAYLASLERVAARYDSAEVLPAHEYRFAGLAHRVRVLLEHHDAEVRRSSPCSSGVARRRSGRSLASSRGPGAGARSPASCAAQPSPRPSPTCSGFRGGTCGRPPRPDRHRTGQVSDRCRDRRLKAGGRHLLGGRAVGRYSEFLEGGRDERCPTSETSRTHSCHLR